MPSVTRLSNEASLLNGVASVNKGEMPAASQMPHQSERHALVGAEQYQARKEVSHVRHMAPKDEARRDAFVRPGRRVRTPQPRTPRWADGPELSPAERLMEGVRRWINLSHPCCSPGILPRDQTQMVLQGWADRAYGAPRRISSRTPKKI
jgi:hypothetical protein